MNPNAFSAYQLENTWVVVLADHGEALGAHGEATHGVLLYDETIRIPLLIRPPGGLASKRIPHPTSLVDVMPTLLAAAGPAGAWAVLLGVPRYAFGAAALVAPWLKGPLADRVSRKVVCVLQLVALLVLQVPFLPAPAALAVVGVTAALLLWSFAVDVVALRRARVPRSNAGPA